MPFSHGVMRYYALMAVVDTVCLHVCSVGLRHSDVVPFSQNVLAASYAFNGADWLFMHGGSRVCPL